MDAVTTGFFVAVGVVAGSFFRLRPSDFSAPEGPLLKRRSGRKLIGWAGIICFNSAVKHLTRRSVTNEIVSLVEA